jgi:Undecaprenyl-phosphate galactose phosphotransferase WbaP
VSSVNRVSPRSYLEPVNQSAAFAFDRATRTNHRTRICSVSLISGDILAFVLATFLAFAIDFAPQLSPYARAIGNLRALGMAWHGWGSLLVCVCLLSYFGGRGHYTSRVPTWTQVVDVVVATAVAQACDVFLTVAIYERPLQPEGVLRWVLLCPCLLLSRTVVRHLLSSTGFWSLRTLIIAPRNEIEAARAALVSDPALGYSVVGSVSPETAAALADDELLHMVSERGADFVVIAVGGGNADAERDLLSSLRRAGLPIALVPALRGMPVTGFRQHYFLGHDIVMLVNRDNLVTPVSRLMKTTFDQIGALAMLLLLSPLMVTLAALVRAEGGAAFYRHRRIGSGGREFECVKFRTMVPNADEVLRRLISNDPRAATEWSETQKLRDDPRVTALGRFLRRSSLDELPQLINVLRGEMSLVGPRPIVRAEVARYGESIEYYYAAKPGITGLWQVSGRSDVSYDRRVRLDVWYVRNWTLWHDVAILLRTIPAVFLHRGAH